MTVDGQESMADLDGRHGVHPQGEAMRSAGGAAGGLLLRGIEAEAEVERDGAMITIADILHLEDIDLELKMTNQEEAINHVASLLKEDERVTDWNAFYKGLASKQPCVGGGGRHRRYASRIPAPIASPAW